MIKISKAYLTTIGCAKEISLQQVYGLIEKELLKRSITIEGGVE